MQWHWKLNGKIPEPENDFWKWAEWLETADRIVKRTELPIDGVVVSTIFLGLNHAFFDGPPILFETMVFGGEYDLYTKRYSTWEQAEIGHQEAIELIFTVNNITTT